MAHPDFRVGGKIFATLGYPDAGFGMVKLPPELQEALVAAEPAVYSPAAGAWGRGGATCVRLKAAKAGSLGPALVAAWQAANPSGASARKAPAKAKRTQR